jgi:hypothetical protein
MQVKGVYNRINATIGIGVNKFAEWPRISNFLKQGVQDPAGFAAKMMVISLVSKDAANGVIYTYQSATNKKVPEDRRNFNTWLDGIQGVFNVGGQIVSYYIVDRMFTPKWFGKMYSGTFKNPDTKQTIDLADKYGNSAKKKSRLLPDNIRGAVNDTIESIVSNKALDKKDPNYKLMNKIKDLFKQKKDELSKMDKADLKEKITKQVIREFKEDSVKFKSIEKGFALVVTALATTALVKRTLVPLTATPLAAYCSDLQKKHTEKKKEELDLEATSTALDRYENPVNRVYGGRGRD